MSNENIKYSRNVFIISYFNDYQLTPVSAWPRSTKGKEYKQGFKGSENSTDGTGSRLLAVEMAKAQ